MTTAHDKEIKLTALEERCQLNDAMVKILVTENRELNKVIQSLERDIPIPIFEAKWKEIRFRLMQLVERIYQGNTVPAFNLVQLHLRRKIMLGGTIWNWELVFPEEMGNGRHCKIMDLTGFAFLPACSEQNETFVRFLVDSRYIHQFIMVDSSGGCSNYARVDG